MSQPSKCSSCGAAILWLNTAKGKSMPVDAEPSEGGNIRISRGVAEVLSKPDQKDEPLHKSHFATCPNAATHRKK